MIARMTARADNRSLARMERPSSSRPRRRIAALANARSRQSRGTLLRDRFEEKSPASDARDVRSQRTPAGQEIVAPECNLYKSIRQQVSAWWSYFARAQWDWLQSPTVTALDLRTSSTSIVPRCHTCSYAAAHGRTADFHSRAMGPRKSPSCRADTLAIHARSANRTCCATTGLNRKTKGTSCQSSIMTADAMTLAALVSACPRNAQCCVWQTQKGR